MTSEFTVVSPLHLFLNLTSRFSGKNERHACLSNRIEVLAVLILNFPLFFFLSPDCASEGKEDQTDEAAETHKATKA